MAQPQQDRVVLPQVHRSLAAGADAGELPASQPVPSITVTLKRSAAQQADLESYLAAVHTVGSPDDHHWLTAAEFAKRFAPSADDVAKVSGWLTAQGLAVTGVSAGGMRMTASGTVAQADAAFAVSLHRMVLAGGDAVAVEGDVSVPSAMAASVASVSGLDGTSASTDPVTLLEASVDQDASAVVVADLTASTAAMEELNAALEQASAQGQTVVALHVAAGLLPARALVVVTQPVSADAFGDGQMVTPRPAWQVAAGLPDGLLRAAPDALAGDANALAAALNSVAEKSGRQGEIAARVYALAVQPGIFSHADTSAAQGSWTAVDGLGTVNLAALVKALDVGATNPLSSVIALSSHNVVHGKDLTLTATITGGSGTPTGSVTFASAQGGTVGSAALSNGVATLTTHVLAGGQYGLFGTYSGDSTYAQSTTNVDTVTIQPESAQILGGVSGTPLVGSTMRVTVTVTSASGVGTPAGAVTVNPYGTVLGQQAFTGTLAPSIPGSATATVSIPATNAGTFTFQTNCTTDASFSCYQPVGFSVTIAKGTPAFTLTQTGTASAATLTANVTAPVGSASTVVAPTGSVQFLDNGTPIGNGLLSTAGVATYTGPLGSGATHGVTARYVGDGSYNPATATANATTVKVTPGVVLAVVTSGSSLSATVAAPAGTSVTAGPTGTVQFLDGATVLGSGVLNASGVATWNGTYTSGAGNILTALYAGDSNFNSATSNAIDTAKVTPVVLLTKTSSSSDGTVSLSAAVSSTASTVATGTVQFLDGTVKIGTGMLSASGVATFSGAMAGTAAASIRRADTSTVTHTLTAAYGGDSHFNAATSNAVTADVTSTLIATSTALTSASGFSGPFGTSFTLNVVVTPVSFVPSGAAPGGAVTIRDASGVVGTGTLSGGNASIAITTLSVGSHALVATYAGDTNYAASISALPLAITITPVAATITAVLAPTGVIPYGENGSLNLTATANGGSVAPAGTVAATVSGNNGTYTATLAATGTGATTSTATLSFPVPPPGTYTITIACNPNLTCNAASVRLTTKPGLTTTTITGVPGAPQAGVPVTLSAAVANSGTGTATYTYSGTVSFYAGNRFLGRGSVANGTASASVVFLSAAATPVTAVYSGDVNWNGSTSDPVTVTPTPVAASALLSASATNGIVGQNITLTATIGSAVSGTTLVPGGTVTFYDTFGGVVANLGSASLLSNGLNAAYATLSTTGLRPGTHSIAAVYSGDQLFLKQTSSALSINMGDFALTFLPTAPMVTQGGTVKVTVGVVGVNNFSGSIALGCTPPPSTLTACSVTPSAVNTGSTATLTVTTTKSTVALVTPRQQRAGGELAGGLAGMLALCSLGGRRRRLASLLLLLVAVVLMAGGCATQSSNLATVGDGGDASNNGTPFGTLTFSVTGAAVDAPIAARHTAVLSVTVQ